MRPPGVAAAADTLFRRPSVWRVSEISVTLRAPGSNASVDLDGPDAM
jgi:hypothetical protein